MPESIVLMFVLAAAGYVLGSLSSAVLVCRMLGHPDPRSDGSGNPGATNVLRIANRRAAALTLAGDVLKGILAVALARLLADDPVIWGLAGMGAFLGHLFPVFFGFRGGKGVATALGVLVALSPAAGAITVVIWLLVFAASRYSSLSALSAFALAPVVVAWASHSTSLTVITGAISIMLFWRHRGNVIRLLRGEERKS